MKWYNNFYCKVWLPVKQSIKNWWYSPQRSASKRDDENDKFDHPYIIL